LYFRIFSGWERDLIVTIGAGKLKSGDGTKAGSILTLSRSPPALSLSLSVCVCVRSYLAQPDNKNFETDEIKLTTANFLLLLNPFYRYLPPLWDQNNTPPVGTFPHQQKREAGSRKQEAEKDPARRHEKGGIHLSQLLPSSSPWPASHPASH
jgi:hypothetical protein